MTTDQTEQEPVDPGDTDNDPGDTDNDTGEEQTDRDISEARKYRKRAQEAEASVAELTAQNELMATQVDTLRRAHVERIAAEQMVNAPDLWLVHQDVDAFLDDQGDVNADAVTAAIASIVADRPHWRKLAPIPQRPKPRPGVPLPSRPTGTDETPGQWAAALGGQSVL